ncbi:MAG: 3-phosphoglycerate dehydrogenase, partial [Defluviitaleaceae bacterium]|nr:3-phosphoglycerate dehydrogenase [Defluviitaleaceae bacterium]
MYKILTLNNIAKCGTDELPHEKFSVSDNLKDPDGIILRSYAMTEDEINTPGLLGIARAGVGVNNIPVEACAEKGIVVFNTPGANAIAVKELVIAGMLLASRRIVDGINWTQSQKGAGGVSKSVEQEKARFAGPELFGKKLGVIGLGAIGGMVANACNYLGMDVCGIDPYISIDAAWALSRSVKKAESPDALYAESDFITLHATYTEETKHMCGEEFFSKCK